MAWFIGLMSGTSLDGVDGVLAHRTADEPLLLSHAHVHVTFEATLRRELLALNHASPNELHRAALAGNALARSYAAVTAKLLDAVGLESGDVQALGAHGQTVRHQPGAVDGTGYTLQLLNGALLAELTGIDVVCDFRSRDVAAGGEGAPLVPAFHAACFAQPGVDHAVLNLGGIANLTVLHGDGRVLGFDTGPANVLMDAWCQRHLGTPFDASGAWAAGGHVNDAVLQRWLDEPYFARWPPKSTGRDLFNLAWLESRLQKSTALAPQTVMATLAELTARTVADALRQHAPTASALWVCGGGAFNNFLMARLSALLPGVPVRSTSELGIAADQVEALAFAWLAQAFCARRAGNLPSVTGARGPRVLGALYPAA